MYFSIITINFNNRDGLKKTIDSVLSQTFTDYEYIIIDGGSTDGSREVIESVKDRLAYWCSEPDKGIYNAMNKGIAKAKGEYLNFMNSGDVFYNDNVLSLINHLKVDVDIITGVALRADNYMPVKTFSGSIVRQLITNSLDHQAAFIKRTLFDNNLYNEQYKIVSDWEFWIKEIIVKHKSYLHVNSILAVQDKTGISSIEEYRGLNLKERKDVLNKYFPALVIKELRCCYEKENEFDSLFLNSLRTLRKKKLFLYRLLRKLTILFSRSC